jgi:hypothetical protein
MSQQSERCRRLGKLVVELDVQNRRFVLLDHRQELTRIAKKIVIVKA